MTIHPITGSIPTKHVMVGGIARDDTDGDYTTALAEAMERIAVLIEYDPSQPHVEPEFEHRDDMPADDALWECYDLWASGAWDDRNAEYNLEEVEQHLARYDTTADVSLHTN